VQSRQAQPGLFALPLPIALAGAVFYVVAMLIVAAALVLLAPIVLLVAAVTYLKERRSDPRQPR
jgi:hypothetical protein